MSALQQISKNVFVYEDIANAYVIRSGEKALCIDFGLGHVLDKLSEIGVRRLEWVLHTHHHRDQCQGTHRAVAQGAKVAVPFSEYHFFAQAELFASRRATQNMYAMHSNHFTLRESVPVSEKLSDFATFSWEGYDFKILPCPGHTMGSIALRVRIDDQWLIFSGDAIRDGAEVENLHSLQYNYGANDAYHNLFRSLEYLKDLGCAKLLPSHGPVINDPDVQLHDLMQKIRRWMLFYNDGCGHTLEHPEIIEVTKNVYCTLGSDSLTYCLLSENGEAIFVDYGAIFGQGFFQNYLHKGGEGNRFIPHSIDLLKDRGLKSIKAFTPTHYHDDHLNGMPYLIQEHGAEIWIYENMVPHIENPYRELLGCSLPEGYKVDRVIKEGERIQWNEFDFTVKYTPGHCDYHMTLFMEHDSERIAISGDVMFHQETLGDNGEIIPRFNVIPLNKLKGSDHYDAACTIADFNPTVICPGHGRPYAVNSGIMDNFKNYTKDISLYLGAMTGDRSLNEALSFHWCQAIPFEQKVEVAVPFKVTVKLSNYRNETMNGLVSLVGGADWQIMPNERKIHVHAGDSKEVVFDVVITDKKPGTMPYVQYGIQLELDGKDQGEVGQGQVELL